MSQGRDDAGRFEETVPEQEILNVFDYEDDPVLTVTAVAEGLRRFGKQMTSEGVRNRFEAMAEKELVSRKQLGARAVGWWANVAPELDGKPAETVESPKGATEWNEL